MQKILAIGLINMLLLSGCSFDNRSGQFSLDLNNADNQRDNTITGTYQTKPVQGGQRYEEMRIESLGQDVYQVLINTPDVVDGCQFNAQAKINNGQLFIPLSEQNPRLRSTMKITFNRGKATVDSTRPEHFNDLKTFCGSGSLVGKYHKIP
ncbi:MAG: hypothetical protein CR975_03895 [Gammaproteobacteria bacterium]|nr:MAG: hypothetical protein CR975_03895 [Gammaproteobacteria bacterium]